MARRIALVKVFWSVAGGVWVNVIVADDVISTCGETVATRGPGQSADVSGQL